MVIAESKGDLIIFQERDGHIELISRSRFTIEDLIKKYRGFSTKKATDEQIRKARENSWVAGWKK